MPPEYLKLAEYAVFGAVGALIGAAAKNRSLELPRVTRKKEKSGAVVKSLDLGFLTAPLLGAVLAAVVDGRPQTGIAYGLAAGFAGPAIINAVLDPIIARLGMPLAPTPTSTTRRPTP